MAKYYIHSGTLSIIYSTNKNVHEACKTALWETNEHDILDEYFYVDERGYKDYTTANKQTIVIPTDEIISDSDWTQI